MEAATPTKRQVDADLDSPNHKRHRSDLGQQDESTHPTDTSENTAKTPMSRPSCAPPADKRCTRPIRYEPGTNTPMRVIIPREKPDFQIKRADFKQAFNEVMQEIDTKVLWKMEVVKVLHELAEIYLVDFFEKAQLAAEHAGKVVVQSTDFQLVRKMQSLGI